MCGILGYFNVNGIAEADISYVRQNLTRLRHRGPDYHDLWSDSQLVVGHSRLSIQDTSEAANQPFHKNDAQILSFNGEIYNHLNLRSEYLSKSDEFKSSGDTETLYHLLVDKGTDAIDLLRGMFAICWYDAQKQELILIRDSYGIKPLYTLEKNGGIWFSSELRPLFDLKAQVSEAALQQLLRFQCNPGEKSILSHVKSLEPGTFAKVDSGGTKIFRWHQFQKPKLEIEKRDYALTLKKHVENAVASRLISDVPLGVFLSGGIDSSVIVAAMRNRFDGPIHSFTIGFEDHTLDERKIAKKVSETFNTTHSEVVLTEKEIVELIPEAIDALDRPSGDAINTYLVSKYSRDQGLKVTLSGLGGDELFSGYPSFGRFYKWKKVLGEDMFPGKLARTIPSELLPGKIRTLLREGFNPKSVVESSRMVWDIEAETDPSFMNNYLRGNITDQDRLTLEEWRTYTIPLLLLDADIMGMANSQEIRVPFFDRDLVEFVLSLPDHFRMPRGAEGAKWMLIEAFKSELPREVYNRKKQGFVLPLKNWMKNEIRDFVREYYKPISGCVDLSQSSLDKTWKQFDAGKDDRLWSRIWLVVVINRWLETNRLTN